MADRPIIFSAATIRALLAGRKSQDRQVLKPQPYSPQSVVSVSDGRWMSCEPSPITGGTRQMDPWRDLPHAIGDRLWVREAHYLTDTGDFEIAVFSQDSEAVREHVDLINRIAAQYGLPESWKAPHLSLRSPIHMHRWASRLTLTVTEVRVQRLHDITEADALAEGVGSLTVTTPKLGLASVTAIEGYRDLWNILHGPAAWPANPWVAAISFTVRQGNIDSIERAE